MKRLILLVVFTAALSTLFAQTADSLQALARTQLQQGAFYKACQTLAIAVKSNPDNIDLLKDQLFANILNRDFATSLELGKALVQKPGADAQCYQLYGSVYKELAEYKEGDKVYREALKKFPESGILYSEYGDLLSQSGNKTEAIAILEKGIKTDVNTSGNYFYAAKYYIANGNLLLGLLYGEIFVNLESYSQHTSEMKFLLYTGYQDLLKPKALDKTANGKEFVNMVAAIMKKNVPAHTDSVSISNIIDLRWKFILDWAAAGNIKQYPFRLFDLHKQLVDGKMFDAYNQWLFGTSANDDAYQNWQAAHTAEMDRWLTLLHNVVFKIPPGQYYGK